MSAPAWREVFPELAGQDDVDALLAWADGLDDDLPPHGAPGWRSTTTGDGADEVHDDGVFGAVVAAVVRPAVAPAVARLTALPVVGGHPRVAARLEEAARRLVADEVVRPLMGLLAEDRAAGALVGDDPRDRYGRWVAALLSPAGWARIEARHPDLLPRASALAARRADALTDVLAATARHWDEVAPALGVPVGDQVVDVLVGGDSHGGGRSVLVLTTSSGARCVVKPRSAAVEAGYAEFSAWLGREALGLDLPRPAVVERAGLTWVEHVAPGPTRHPDHFAMLGVHLAALHLLRGTDVHYENLLTDRHGRPVVVDAEALFTPSLGAAAAQDVDATGLLSTPFGEDFDFGALDYRAGSTSPFRAWHVEGAGTDEVRFEMRPVTVDTPEALRGDRPGPGDAEAVVGALETCLARVAAAPEEVVARVLRVFPAGRVRMILRPTMAYALVARMATHPRFTADTDRRRVLARLAVLPPAVDPVLLASEVRQLTAGEIPAFGVDVHADRVLDAYGRDTGVRTARSPFDDVAAAVLRVDRAHVERQVAIARASTAHWRVEPAPATGSATTTRGGRARA
ncbi:DUF4135 domain-containing protein [Nocardioides sp. CPCC 205120]|uniref:DUF4135 domain-containing protein n=1 Tax=Nocardioides sp. CPCC 205120 TaxID=3406462 RepID=UPI003B50CB26